METAKEYWDDELQDLAPSTRDLYRRYFNKFIERFSLSPEELYNLQNEGRLNEDPRKAQVVELMVRKYMRELQDEGYAPGTARNVAKAVSSFMIANKLPFSLRKKPKAIYNGSLVIRPEHIRLIYNDIISSEFLSRNRAIMMFLKDSGLRVSDVGNLDASDYSTAREEHNDEGEVFKILKPVGNQKTGHIAHIHIGPEAVKSLDTYLDGRETGPLFISRSGGRLTGLAMTSLFLRLVKPLRTMGFKVSAHSFRKFHKTSLEGKGVAGDWIKLLQGKSADVYSQPHKTGALTRKYIECYDGLRIFGEDLRREIDQLKEKFAENQRRWAEAKESQTVPMTLKDGVPILHRGETRRIEEMSLQQKLSRLNEILEDPEIKAIMKKKEA